MNLKRFLIGYSEADGSEYSCGVNRYLDGKETFSLNGHWQLSSIDINHFFGNFEWRKDWKAWLFLEGRAIFLFHLNFPSDCVPRSINFIR